MTDECYELKTIQFKTMIMNKNKSNNSGVLHSKNGNDCVDILLEDEKMFQESQLNSKPWNKLNKMIKVQKLMEYCEVLKDNHTLSLKEFNKLKKYIVSSIDKKKLLKNKEIEYDIGSMKITNIPNLVIVYQNDIKKFTLKNNEKKNSTLKNLPKGIIKTLKQI